MTHYEAVGIHVLMNIHDVSNSLLLTDLVQGKKLSKKIVDALQLHVVGESCHQFQPGGYTMLYLLSESHYSIHTYPEYNSCYIDIFCCNKDFLPKRAVEIISELFDTNRVEYQVIKRN